jgi:hypothetical protein
LANRFRAFISLITDSVAQVLATKKYKNFMDLGSSSPVVQARWREKTMTEAPIQVVYIDHGGEGYHCMLHMARLAAELLNGELVVVPPLFPTLAEKLSGIFLSPKGSRSCLFICPFPADLSSILLVPNWRQTFSRIVAWVFDSFWTDWIPPWARASRIFDHVFVTEQEDLKTWRRRVRAPVDWLPWGSDVLNLGSSNAVRPIDLLRFGRQPKEWDDDQVNARLCQSSGINFHGRPPSLSDATDNERGLMGMLSKTKLTLAFTNRVSPGAQTHHKREYITGRWTDSLAAGATVAGIPPHSESVQSLLWPEALLDIGTVNQTEGLKAIDSMVRAWTPDRAQLNYIKSLEILDWRLRFKTLAQALDLHSVRLDAELARLTTAIRSVQPAGTIR